MVGYSELGHVFSGIVATVIDNCQFQNASNDDWTWSALIEFKEYEEVQRHYYPEKYLKLHKEATK